MTGVSRFALDVVSTVRRGLVIAGGMSILAAAKCPWKTNTAAVPSRSARAAIPDSADQLVIGMRTILTEQSVSKGILLSDTAYVYDDGSRLELLRVHLTFRTAQGRKDGVLTARAGTYNSRLSRLDARGDVVVVREDGMRLESPQLVFDQARNQIFSDSAFTLTQPSRTITGIGFESDPHLTTFRCLRACKGLAPVNLPVK